MMEKADLGLAKKRMALLSMREIDKKQTQRKGLATDLTTSKNPIVKLMTKQAMAQALAASLESAEFPANASLVNVKVPFWLAIMKKYVWSYYLLVVGLVVSACVLDFFLAVTVDIERG